MSLFVRLTPEIFLWKMSLKNRISSKCQLLTLTIKEIELSSGKSEKQDYAYITIN